LRAQWLAVSFRIWRFKRLLADRFQHSVELPSDSLNELAFAI
jgi:hypothetical protein